MTRRMRKDNEQLIFLYSVLYRNNNNNNNNNNDKKNKKRQRTANIPVLCTV